MYLHLGQNIVVNYKDIIGIFDIDKTTIGKISRDFLAHAEKFGKIINVSMELPKSFIVCKKGSDTIVYISQISPTTLLKRSICDENIG